MLKNFTLLIKRSLTGLGNETVTISDATLAAADLKASILHLRINNVSAATSYYRCYCRCKGIYTKAGFCGITGLGTENSYLY